jgi:uncharacterized protein (TIGR03437 family)
MQEFLSSEPLVFVRDSAVDVAGNVYLAGFTRSDRLPTTAAAFQPAFTKAQCGLVPCFHSFVVKLDASGTRVAYATYLGGSGEDRAQSISVDASGAAYVAGYASSPDFPAVTSGSYRSTPGKGFVARLSPDGTALAASTYVDAQPWRVVAHASGDVFVAGGATGESFATTAGVIQTTPQGAADAFVMRLDRSLGMARYSTRLGGKLDDTAYALKVDAGGSAYVAGNTGFSPETEGSFPVTSTQLNRGSTFVSRLSADGSSLVFSALLFATLIQDIALDAAGNVYAGGAPAGDVPYTPGAVYFPQGRFIAKISADGNRLTWAAQVPGSDSGILWPYQLTVSASGRALVWDTSPMQVPTLADAPLPCESELGAHPFLTELNEAGSDRTLSTYLESPIAVAGDFLWSVSKGPGRILDRTPIHGQADPKVTCVAHAATFLSGSVAPGEIVALFGPGIGPDVAASFRLDADGRVPAYLGGVSVYFNGVASPLLYVSKNQINTVVPFETSIWTRTRVEVVKNGAVLPSAEVGVVGANPGVFPVGAGWSILNENGTVNTTGSPARLGSIVTVFLTGAGLMKPSASTGSVAHGTTAIKREVSGNLMWVSGFRSFPGGPLEVLYAGDAPGAVQGLVQLNLRLPSSSVATFSARTTLYFRDQDSGDTVAMSLPVAIR